MSLRLTTRPAERLAFVPPPPAARAAATLPRYAPEGMSLSRQDVILGRALLAWQLVDRQRLLGCAEELRARRARGQALTLGQLLVQRGLLSLERYHAIVAHLRQRSLEASSTSLQAQQAAQAL
ncbi:MAG: hypothetical protein D6731_07945, partial [Planctomycetota bacterium]